MNRMMEIVAELVKMEMLSFLTLDEDEDEERSLFVGRGRGYRRIT